MNIFFVTSPLQLINALEAQSYFGTKNNTLIVLRHSSQGYPISMFKRLISSDDWDCVHFLSTYDDERIKARLNIVFWTYLTFRQKLRIDKLVKTLGPVEALFLGPYEEPIARHFSNILPYKKLYLIDDGTQTPEINDERKALPKQFWHGNLKAKIKHTLLGINNRQADKIIFFSTYNLKTRDGDQLILNRYTHFQKRVNEVQTSDEVWFLGVPLVKDGWLSSSTYLRYLKRLHQHYREQIFIYLPHSRERREDIDLVCSSLGCEARYFGVPVEYALRDASPRPKELVSFFSAALLNCHIMFNHSLQITSVYLAPEDLLSHQNYVANTYQAYSKISGAGFRILFTLECAFAEAVPSG